MRLQTALMFAVWSLAAGFAPPTATGISGAAHRFCTHAVLWRNVFASRRVAEGARSLSAHTDVAGERTGPLPNFPFSMVPGFHAADAHYYHARPLLPCSLLALKCGFLWI